MSEPAPFYADLAQGPEGGQAVWVRAADGVRIRLGLWRGGQKGVVLLLPGRTEYIEKYGRTARELLARGWSVLAIDWRGQGLSDRLHADPMIGHVGRFSDYQLDLDAALAWLDAMGPQLGLAQPRVMLAHSMGGLIGLRALYRGLTLRAAVFSAPMWGIRMPLWRRASAAVLSRTTLPLPQDLGYAPTTSGRSYMMIAPFEGNHLTSDPEMWDYLVAQVKAEPRFGLGGPSLHWVRQAVREARAVMALPALDLPMITALGGHEAIVLADPIRKRMASWPQGRLDLYPDAHHEIPIELPEIRDLFYRRTIELFDRSLPAAAQAAR